MWRLLGVLAVVAGLLPACLADCEATPYARLPVAAVRPPLVAPPPAAIAACPPLVAFDGRQYEYSAWGPWDIEADALRDIGIVTGSNHPLSANERRVFAIDGVPPDTAIAIRVSDGEGVTVLLSEGIPFAASLCPYLKGDRPLSCDEPTGAPASTKSAAP